MTKAKLLIALPLLLLASCESSTGAPAINVNDTGWRDDALYIAVETYANYLAADYDKLEYYIITYNNYKYGRDIHVRTTLDGKQRTRHYYNVSFEIEFCSND